MDFVKIVLSFILVLLVKEMNGQNTYSKLFGNDPMWKGTCPLSKAPDGSDYLGFSSGVSNTSITAVKLNNAGDTIWTKSFDAVGDEVCNSIFATTDNGLIIAGTTNSFSSKPELLLIRTDSNGNTIWHNSYNTSPEIYPLDILESSDGSFMITGYIHDSVTIIELFIAKIDSAGNLLWSKKFGDHIIGYSIIECSDHNFMICGDYQSDALLMKIDTSGNIIWNHTYYFNTCVEYGTCVIQTDDGGFLCGGLLSNFGISHISGFLWRTDPSGNLIWTKTLNSFIVQIEDIRNLPGPNYVLSGAVCDTLYYSQTLIAKFDDNGDFIWANTESTRADGKYILEEPDSGFIISNFDLQRIRILKANSIGEFACNSRDVMLDIDDPIIHTYIPSMIMTNLPMTTTSVVLAHSSLNYVAEICSGITSVQETNEPIFNIYPNPSHGKISFNFEYNTGYHIAIFNAIGCKVYSANKTKSDSNFDLSLPAGMYEVVVTNSDHSYSQKVFIE